ncbi:Protein export cytoplasm protein SecA ATPase RNA helicase [Candidatus Rhodobacter oscarellae]|uniref:Protein export cytoplasm protein SecA ATPase RNA helicase n=1 Tax=Candidatus Rhodobacter oscarellae TaxID=1675527 RepID=A0A0J9H4F1_9RHOB|nr:Protein export cytoplasm protein SecA ATPase RNA helicase [Candidatus Rhodobacter lobularis]
MDDVSWVLRPDAEAFLALLHDAFRYMEGRVDPPSSLHRMTAQQVRDFAADEVLLAILDKRGKPLACLFVTVHPDHLYLGKLAVHPSARGQGLARALLDWVEQEAHGWDAQYLELQTRVELTENHAYFARQGFAETGRTAHPGYDRPTSLTMTRRLPPR